MTTFFHRPEAPAETEAASYAGWTKGELEAELQKRGLPTSGNKPDLIARLEENDAS